MKNTSTCKSSKATSGGLVSFWFRFHPKGGQVVDAGVATSWSWPLRALSALVPKRSVVGNPLPSACARFTSEHKVTQSTLISILQPSHEACIVLLTRVEGQGTERLVLDSPAPVCTELRAPCAACAAGARPGPGRPGEYRLPQDGLACTS